MQKKWYEQDKMNSDIVLSSRIRLARNCKNINFTTRMTVSELNKLNSLVILSLENINFGNNTLEVVQMNNASEIMKAAMVENHVISTEFSNNCKDRILLLSSDNSISVMVGEEDHIRLQVCMSGDNLEKAYELANMVDDVLDEGIGFAFDQRLGYLTSCPTNVGTGLRASVMVHIPAMEQNNKIKELSYTLSKLGFTIRGSYGEGSRSIGSTYQISNQITLGISEQDILTRLQDITQKITQSELEARNIMVKNSIKLRDSILRSYGVVNNAVLISSEESIKLISNLRIGITTGLINDIDSTKLLIAENKISSASICNEQNRLVHPEQRDEIRASIIKELINNINN